jgi:uncharacterized protein
MIGIAIILGLAGSLHCMLMCSPLAVAVTNGGKHLVKKLLYNGGRIFTYAIAGALVAAFGKMVSLSGFQVSLTICIGMVLMIMGISGISGLRIPFITSILLKFTTIIKNFFNLLLQRKTMVSIFLLGMINGILPCGVTFLALTYCLTVSSPLDGFNFMLWFGAGTLPAMLGLTSVVGIVIRKYHLNASRITRYSYLVLGLIVIGRLFMTNHEVVNNAIANGAILICQ